jgi:hypothetical protein
VDRHYICANHISMEIINELGGQLLKFPESSRYEIESRMYTSCRGLSWIRLLTYLKSWPARRQRTMRRPSGPHSPVLAMIFEQTFI